MSEAKKLMETRRVNVLPGECLLKKPLMYRMLGYGEHPHEPGSTSHIHHDFELGKNLERENEHCRKDRVGKDTDTWGVFRSWIMDTEQIWTGFGFTVLLLHNCLVWCSVLSTCKESKS